MNDTASTLRDLHRMHQQLADLKDRVARGPKAISARQAQVTRMEQALSQLQADIKAARMAVDQKNLQLKSGEGKIQELRVKLNSAASNREYQALLEQIAASEMANSVLADEIIDALEKVDEREKAVNEAKENLSKAQQELAVTQSSVGAKQAALEEEVQRVESELRGAETHLAADIRDYYQRMVGSKGAEGMAQVEGNVCGGCFQQLTPNNINTLRLQQLVLCGSCGRMLYLPEDRTPGRV